MSNLYEYYPGRSDLFEVTSDFVKKVPNLDDIHFIGNILRLHEEICVREGGEEGARFSRKLVDVLRPGLIAK